MTNLKLFLTITLVSGFFLTVNYILSPVIEVETIDGVQMVISVDGKDTYRPLTKTDKLEAIIITKD